MVMNATTPRPRKRRPWVGFTLAAICAVLAVAVLHGPIAGVFALVAMLGFIGACMNALRGHDPDAIRRGDRAAIGGWFGGWF
jgi:hypothetical protein